MIIEAQAKNRIRNVAEEHMMSLIQEQDKKRRERSKELYGHEDAFISVFFMGVNDIVKYTINETIRQIEKL